ncbi:phosphohistidinoprotein-hexose phosphotransferase [Ureaplasma diversum]|uniref:Phosphocarrier protein HPr n=2 Tax=Ureaplasma diversum TaxID=42094 RepID=A0A084EYA3_9BACT|nr:HPr family phosphocarrier protein [Ureaplasma diversum]AJQ45557.1 phosphohistidinoprotein-hexose phosphotransferase [Ureaplasma diversum]KEZ22945.1 Phosphocarrier protein HPr [Ureaplasma diversum NCTC 246]
MVLSVSKKFVIKMDLATIVHEITYFCHAAGDFSSKIEIKVDNKKADAKSIINIMALGIKQDSEIELTATGSDAQNAITRLEEILRQQAIID